MVSTPKYLLPKHLIRNPHRIMIFIDGENAANGYQRLLQSQGLSPDKHALHIEDVAFWPAMLKCSRDNLSDGIKRIYCFTSAPGSQDERHGIEDKIKAYRIESPHVFHRPRGRRSKRVDISLATEMLLQGTRDNYDVAVLVTGDEDFVPVVEAVKSLGKIVVLWSFSEGLSTALRRAADHFADFDQMFI